MFKVALNAREKCEGERPTRAAKSTTVRGVPRCVSMNSAIFRHFSAVSWRTPGDWSRVRSIKQVFMGAVCLWLGRYPRQSPEASDGGLDWRLGFDECQQVGVDGFRVGGGHAVRKPLVGF